MAWFFLLFFGLVALCAAVYLALLLKDRLSPKIECGAVVEKRYTENFPLTMGFVKRDRRERHLAFAAENGSVLDFTVDEELYKVCPAGTRGRLVYQGRRLVRFEAAAVPNGGEQSE